MTESIEIGSMLPIQMTVEADGDVRLSQTLTSGETDDILLRPYQIDILIDWLRDAQPKAWSMLRQYERQKKKGIDAAE